MKQLKPLEKGTYLYINNRKKRLILFSGLSMLGVFIIFLTGIIIYHTNKSIYAVIAALAALPAAKLITLLAVIIPYKSGDADIYNTLMGYSKNQNGILTCDLAIASSSKISFIQFAYILDGKVFLYSDYKKLDVSFTEKHIKDILSENCNFSSVKLYSDKDRFISKINALTAINDIANMDKRISQKLISYSM
ncbi:MAG: hypothetical protein K2M73_05760 [Lachnospiraceae bacterium]|nr:hypothetical protein [Lachnospiraceae bacterium]